MSSYETLERLYQLAAQRRTADPKMSYIAKRFSQGTEKIAQKFGEEAVETVIAAVKKDKPEIINESADFLFHWLLLLVDSGVALADVMKELERREGTSGLDEKARRRIDENKE